MFSTSQQDQLFERWMRDHRGLIYRVVMLYASEAAAQEDLYQEIALALWRSIPRFEGRSLESTWIYRVALNTALSSRRAADRRPWTTTFEEVGAAGSAGEPRIAPEPDGQVAWLYDRIRTLSPIDRSLVLLYLDGNSHDEIAAVLGISPGAVGVKIHRVKNRLKKLLEEE
jgi:RNA polymerase sigma-70 factor (ECF subfamily)